MPQLRQFHPPQGHLISQWGPYGDDASDEELFERYCELGHMPATLTFRTMWPRTLRALSFQDLAEREVQHRHWRCEQERPGEHIQVFQVQFDLGEGDGPWWRSEYVGCRHCEGWGPRTSLACPEHQFALSERQLQILWIMTTMMAGTSLAPMPTMYILESMSNVSARA